MTTLHQVTVGDCGLFALKHKVEKLNKRAAKNNLPGIELDVRTVTFVPVHKSGLGVEQPLHFVSINGVEPRIDGWRLVCRLELNTAIGTVVRVAPGIEDDGSFAQYRDYDGLCEHCNTKRYRKDVYVLEKDGCRKVVGRNCLADFCRNGDAEALGWYAECWDRIRELDAAGLDEYGESNGYGQSIASQPLEVYLTVVNALTRLHGWVSRSESKDTGYRSTADLACGYFNGRSRYDDKLRDTTEITPGDRELAAKAIEWAAGAERKSEYINTISRIAELGMLDWKLDGYAASITRAYQKAQEWAQERKEKEATRKPKEFIGDVKQRLRDVDVIVKRVRYFEGQYGVTTIVAMEADLGDSVAPITWFASGSQEYDEGEAYKLTGTVKKHEDNDKFGKQTMVNRCKLEKVA